MTYALNDPELHEALVEEFGIGDEDLDEAVYDLENGGAAQEYNDGAHAELDDESAYDRVHDHADGRAQRINNQGPVAQVAYLARVCRDVDALRGLLAELLERQPGAAAQS